jgi:hypothetical protein
VSKQSSNRDKSYLRNIQAFEWSADVKPNKLGGQKMRNFIRKDRQKGKKEIRNELKTKHKSPKTDG